MTTERRIFYPPRNAVMGIAGGIGSFGLAVLGLAVGSALFFSWMNSETVWSIKNACVCVPLGGFGLLLMVMMIHFWRLGRVPLVVEADGRVTFQGKEMIAAGAAREVVVLSKIIDNGEGPLESFCLVVRYDGGEIELPTPYFSEFGARADADETAVRIAAALRIPVVQDPAGSECASGQTVPGS